jgi:hypothetical protein
MPGVHAPFVRMLRSLVGTSSAAHGSRIGQPLQDLQANESSQQRYLKVGRPASHLEV